MDLNILLNELIAKDKAANGSGPGLALEPVATDGQVPVPEGAAGESTLETSPAATTPSTVDHLASPTPSKLRYYLPFFEILGLLIFILVINLFIFGSLRSITGSVVRLEHQITDQVNLPRASAQLNQFILNGLSGVSKDPTAVTLLISRMLASHLDEGDHKVEVLTSNLVSTQEALSKVTEELVVLSKNQALVRKSLYCLSQSDSQKIDPAASELCAGLKDELLQGLKAT